MPTAQARLTRTRGLHATRSSIRSDNDMSSLSERRIARRFFLYRWHRAHTCHPLNFRTATSADRWPPGSQACMTCAPCPSWAHVRVWGAAGRGCHTPASPGSAHFVRSCYVNRALLGISTSAVACGSCQRLPRRAHVPRTGSAGHTRLGTRLSVGGGRCPEIQGVARVRTMPSEQEECMRDSSLWQRAHMILCSDTATGRMQATRSCHTRLCRRHRQPGSSNRKARSTLQSRCALVLTHTWMQMSLRAMVGLWLTHENSQMAPQPSPSRQRE